MRPLFQALRYMTSSKLPSGHQTCFGRPMDVYMKSRLHTDVHWTSKVRLIPTALFHFLICVLLHFKYSHPPWAIENVRIFMFNDTKLQLATSQKILAVKTFQSIVYSYLMLDIHFTTYRFDQKCCSFLLKIHVPWKKYFRYIWAWDLFSVNSW